jgi:hypothetical protein
VEKMTIIERIHSIAKKLGVEVNGETILELMVSLEEGVDKLATLKQKVPERQEYQKRNNDYQNRYQKKRFEENKSEDDDE